MEEEINFKCPRCGTPLTGYGSYDTETGCMLIKVQAVACSCYSLTAIPTQLYLAAGRVFMSTLLDRGYRYDHIYPAPIKEPGGVR